MGRLQRKKKTIKSKKSGEASIVNADSVLGGRLRVGAPQVKDKKQHKSTNKPVVVERKINFISSFIAFLKESRLEIGKVVWPSRRQVIASTIVVIAIATLISLFLGITDAVLSGVIQAILS